MCPPLLIKPGSFALHPSYPWNWDFKLDLSSDPLWMTILSFSLGNWSSSGNFNVNPILQRWKTLECYRIQVLILYYSIISVLRKTFLFPAKCSFLFLKETIMLSALNQGLSLESAWYRWFWTDIIAVILITLIICYIDAMAFYVPKEDKIVALVMIVFCAVFLIMWALPLSQVFRLWMLVIYGDRSLFSFFHRQRNRYFERLLKMHFAVY